MEPGHFTGKSVGLGIRKATHIAVAAFFFLAASATAVANGILTRTSELDTSMDLSSKAVWASVNCKANIPKEPAKRKLGTSISFRTPIKTLSKDLMATGEKPPGEKLG